MSTEAREAQNEPQMMPQLLRQRVRRWTSGRAPITPCNCDPAKERGMVITSVFFPENFGQKTLLIWHASKYIQLLK